MLGKRKEQKNKSRIELKQCKVEILTRDLKEK
jgi:hypothetical protein